MTHKKALTNKDLDYLTNLISIFFDEHTILSAEVYQYVRNNSLFTVHPGVVKEIMLKNGYKRKQLSVFIRD
jgi:hypothetical protein